MNKEYVAGFVDGEGCITITERIQKELSSYRPVLVITNTDKEVLADIAGWLGSDKTPLVIKSKRQSGTPNAKPCYSLTIRGKAILDTLPKFSESLIVKRYQATAIIEAAKLVNGSNAHYSDEIRNRLEYLFNYVKWLNSGCY